MGWKIVRDYYYERLVKECGGAENLPEWNNDNNKGRESYNGYKGKDACRVKVYDDDNNLYYEAVCDGQNSAEAFHDWAEYDSGCTRSTIKDKGKEWQEFIS